MNLQRVPDELTKIRQKRRLAQRSAGAAEGGRGEAEKRSEPLGGFMNGDFARDIHAIHPGLIRANTIVCG